MTNSSVSQFFLFLETFVLERRVADRNHNVSGVNVEVDHETVTIMSKEKLKKVKKILTDDHYKTLACIF